MVCGEIACPLWVSAPGSAGRGWSWATSNCPSRSATAAVQPEGGRALAALQPAGPAPAGLPPPAQGFPRPLRRPEAAGGSGGGSSAAAGRPGGAVLPPPIMQSFVSNKFPPKLMKQPFYILMSLPHTAGAGRGFPLSK